MVYKVSELYRNVSLGKMVMGFNPDQNAMILRQPMANFATAKFGFHNA
jgi:hypothetical protein